MNDLPNVINWRRIGPRLTTSGQPTEDQLKEIKALGVTHVINLGPHHNKGALDDEAATLTALGLEYIYIPVEFENPTEQNFQDFKAALESRPDATIHIHCIYNARVSAFFYRYAQEGFHLSETDAFKNMESIWRPGDDWAALINSTDAVGQPNRYACDDY